MYKRQGGSPGSTAGGVKTTTVIVLVLYLGSTIKRTHGVNIFGRRLEEDSIMRASCICTINLMLALTVATVSYTHLDVYKRQA